MHGQIRERAIQPNRIPLVASKQGVPYLNSKIFLFQKIQFYDPTEGDA